MIVSSLIIPRQEFESETGWALKPEGACKGEICIPLADPPEGEAVNLRSLADQMGLALVADEQHGVWSLGPEAIGDRTLVTAEAPELRLPDLDGNEFTLSSLRGHKVLMVAWSPY